MLNHKFIIVGPGRTGSILIARALSDILKKEIKYMDDTKVINADDCIVHNHDPRLTVSDKSQWIMIVSRRRDKFKGVVSHINAEITNEYNGYSNSKFPKTHIPIETFIKIFLQRDNFYDELDRNGYAKVVDIYLEDVLQYPYYLFDQLGQKIKMPIWTEKCPYGKEMISNIIELETYYQNNMNSPTVGM
jgi:hypothetical protein